MRDRLDGSPVRIRADPGRRRCGALEPLVHREFTVASAQNLLALDSITQIAAVPLLCDRVLRSLDAIYVGGGAVPGLDDLGEMSGRTVPGHSYTWDRVSGVFLPGRRLIAIGDTPDEDTADVAAHEIGHVIDYAGDDRKVPLVSRSPDFRRLIDRLGSALAPQWRADRMEMFAEAFACIVVMDSTRLLDMVGGDQQAARDVLAWFHRYEL